MGFPLTTSHQLAPIVVPWILLVIATLTVVLRFQARSMQKARYGIDDWLVLAALVISYPYQACNTYAVTKGVAIPMMTILTTNSGDFIDLIKAIYASNIMWSFPVTALQLSVLALYLRIFGVKRWVRYCSWFLISIVILYEVTFFITQLLSCRPMEKFWVPTTPGKCFNQVAFCASMGLIHVFIDFAIVFLPMPLIWNLQTTKSNKAILTVLLGIGLIASLTSLLKLTCLIDFSFITSDVTLSIWYSILMQAIEIPVGIICTCVPTLSPVLSATKQSRFGSSFRHMISSLTSSNRQSRSSSRVQLDGSKDEKTESSTVVVQKRSLSGSDAMHNFSVEALRTNDSMDDSIESNSIRVDRTWNVHR